MQHIIIWYEVGLLFVKTVINNPSRGTSVERANAMISSEWGEKACKYVFEISSGAKYFGRCTLLFWALSLSGKKCQIDLE